MKKLIIPIIGAVLCFAIVSFVSFKSQNKKEELAKEYFKFFHEGNIDKVLGYLSEECFVKYGLAPKVEAKKFFEQSVDFVSTLKFSTKGYYTSKKTNKVLIEFSYRMPINNKGEAKLVDAVDIIEFDDDNKIKSIYVIPND